MPTLLVSPVRCGSCPVIAQYALVTTGNGWVEGLGIGVMALEAEDALPSPTLLVAVTVNVYAVPLVSPVTVAVRSPLDQLAVWPLGLAVTLYPVIAEPPSEDGALQATVDWLWPAVAETLVGAPGTVAGVTELDALDDAPVPILFVAATVNE